MNKNIGYEIKTERLVLRPYVEEDVPSIFKVLSEHPEITKWMLFDPPKKIAETQAFFEESQKNFPDKGITFVILENKKFAGILGMGFEKQKYDTKIDSSSSGYWLDPTFHGRGIMTEAVKGVIDFAFKTLKLHKIELGHFVENNASRRVIEKCGFRKIGVREKHFFRNGKWRDNIEYEKISDFE
jgi:RimJ/RimL family protein N-acetyltransferase